MSHIITLHNNQPTVSHRVIAERTENLQVSISNTINKYILDFEEFGKVHFKNEAIKNSKNKINEVKTFLLNESQATLLLTFLKNSIAVRAFKVALVKEFYKMREELYQKQPEITIVNTTDKERLGTLESQIYMLKNENRELRRAMNRMTYNDKHLHTGIENGEYIRIYGNKTPVTVVGIDKGNVIFLDNNGGGKVNVIDFQKMFKPIQKLLK